MRKFFKLAIYLCCIFILAFIILPYIRELPYIKESFDKSSDYGIKNESLYYSSTPECGQAGCYFRNKRK